MIMMKEIFIITQLIKASLKAEIHSKLQMKVLTLI